MHSIVMDSLKASLEAWLDKAKPEQAMVDLMLLLLPLSVQLLPLLQLLGVLLLLLSSSPPPLQQGMLLLQSQVVAILRCRSLLSQAVALLIGNLWVFV